MIYGKHWIMPFENPIKVRKILVRLGRKVRKKGSEVFDLIGILKAIIMEEISCSILEGHQEQMLTMK